MVEQSNVTSCVNQFDQIILLSVHFSGNIPVNYVNDMTYLDCLFKKCNARQHRNNDTSTG